MNGLSPLGRLPSFHVKSTSKNIAVQAFAKGTRGRCCMISFFLNEITTFLFFGMKTAKKQGAMLYDFTPFRDFYNGM